MTEDGGTSTVRTRISRGIRPVPVLLILLASIEPFVGFLDRNRDEYVRIWKLGQFSLATVAAMIMLYAILLVALPKLDPARIAAGVAAFAFCLFRYRTFGGVLDGQLAVRLGGWLICTVIVVASIILWSRYQNARLFLLLFLLMTTIMPGASYLSHVLGREPVDPQLRSPRSPIDVAERVDRTPNVWWLMLDEYARGDVLQEVHGFDNSAFYDDLQDRQFTVSDDSYTSYPATALSVSSVLDLDYVVTDRRQLRDGPYGVAASLRGKGRVPRAFEAHGYRYFFAESGAFDWAQCDRSVVDGCVGAERTGLPMGDLGQQVASMTPFAEVPSGVRPSPVAAVERVQERLVAGEPAFVFAHVLNPHPPLWYDDDCRFKSTPDDEAGFYEEGYVQQIQCLNPQVIEAVDLILDDDPDAIIIVQSDHGSQRLVDATKPYDQWTADALAERYSILEAMRFPDGCAVPSEAHSNVSTFEYVLACIEGRSPQPLEDRYFMWRHRAPTDLLEIERPAAITSD